MPTLPPLTRGLRGRCPNCGARGVRDGLWELHEACPSCHYGFVREDGYWAGAMTVLMAMVIVGFFTVFMIGVLATWPNVPWTALGIVTACVNVLISLVLYSWAKTIWVGLDLAFNPSSGDEAARD